MKKTRKKSQPNPFHQPQESAFGEYANHVTFRFGPSEATIEFTRIYPGGNGSDWPSEPVTRVTIPLTAAKCLIFGLTSYITSLEAVLGTIRVPPSQVPELQVSSLLHPDAMARLIATHAELFPPAATQPDGPAPADSGALTKH